MSQPEPVAHIDLTQRVVAQPLLGPGAGRPPRQVPLIPDGGRRFRIAVDAAGGDAGHRAVLAGALATLDEVDLLLVGPAAQIEAELGVLPPGVTVLDAPETIGMAEDPIQAVRSKRRSSVMMAAQAVAGGAADAMISSGNAGAFVLAAAARLRRLPGVLQPAMATVLPGVRSGPTVLLDVGATTVARPEWLAQFATMGARYASARFGLAQPRIGLLSNGHEDGKGGAGQLDAHRLLTGLPGYIGRVEAYDLLGGRADVVVTDGFTGDVALKMHERTLDASLATANVVLRRLGAEAHAGTLVDDLWSALAPEGGAVLLGVGGICVKCHGAAPEHDITEAIWLAAECARTGLIGELTTSIRRPAPTDQWATAG